MLTFDGVTTNRYSHTSITVEDNTILYEPEDEELDFTPPEFSFLIPIHQGPGPTNTMQLFRYGELDKYLEMFGDPNATKYGIQPDFIHAILSRPGSKASVYTVNVRGPKGAHANVVVSMRYKIEDETHYEASFVDDVTGETVTKPAYIIYDEVTKGNIVTDVPNDNPIMVKQMKVKFITESCIPVRDWKDFEEKMNAKYSVATTTGGYNTIPWFGFMYAGASAFGNDCTITLSSSVSEYDNLCYFKATVDNGLDVYTQDSFCMSLDPMAGADYSTPTDYYMETKFNKYFSNKSLKFYSSEYTDEIKTLINTYCTTVDDYLLGTQDSPAYNLQSFDVLNTSTLGYIVEQPLASTLELKYGTNGNEQDDYLYEKFFKGEVGDLATIDSLTRFKFDCIPDTGYNTDTKLSIVDFTYRRIRTTTALLMVGGKENTLGDPLNPVYYVTGYDDDGNEIYEEEGYVQTRAVANTGTFASACIDKQRYYGDNMYNVRLIAACQGAKMYNSHTRKQTVWPASYFDTIALCDHFEREGGRYFMPFAGAHCRWKNFNEETILYPAETQEVMAELYKNRINYVQKDDQTGAYIADQQMNTIPTSDQTELNNIFIIQNMLMDCVHLAHRNHFKFNEDAEVTAFKTLVNEQINAKYAYWSASLTVDVYRAGTTGWAKMRNVIKVTVDLKDIAKYTDIHLVLNDE